MPDVGESGVSCEATPRTTSTIRQHMATHFDALPSTEYSVLSTTCWTVIRRLVVLCEIPYLISIPIIYNAMRLCHIQFFTTGTNRTRTSSCLRLTSTITSVPIGNVSTILLNSL